MNTNRIDMKQVHSIKVTALESVGYCYTSVKVSMSYCDWLKFCSKQGWHVSVTSSTRAVALNCAGDSMTDIDSTGKPEFYSR